MKKIGLLSLCLLLCMSLAMLASAYTANVYKEDGTTLIKTVTFEKGVSASLPWTSSTSSKYFLGYVTSDGKQLHRGVIHTEHDGDLELTAKFLDRTSPVPGENFVENGNFDKDSINMFVSDGSLAIVEKDGNRVLQYSRGGKWSSIQHYVPWEIGRKYHVSYRYMIPEGASTVRCTINARYFDSAKATNDSERNNRLSSLNGTAGTWATHSHDFVIPETYVADYNCDALSLYCEPINSDSSGLDVYGVVYYDDIEFIPYNKITYNPNGGSLSESNIDFGLNGTYTVNTSLVPEREGCFFLGWGRTPDATANVSEIELEGKDITLYARWQGADSQPVFMYNFANETKGIADGTITVVAKDSTAGYTKVTLYYANADGILENYTPLKTLKFANGSVTYTVNGKRSFPMEATKIYAVFSADDKDDYIYVYDIPAEKRITEKKEPIVSFYSLSDFHNTTYDYVLGDRSIYYTRENAIRDIFNNKDRYDFVILNGDNICHSKPEHYAKFDAMLDRFKAEDVLTFFTVGNHEFHVSDGKSEKPKLEGGDEEIYLQMLDEHQEYLKTQGYELDREKNGWYYSFEANGIKIIMCATPYPNYATDTCDGVIAGEQLKWLERQLFDAEKSNKPVFVLSHIGIAEYIPPAYVNEAGLANHEELKTVLNRHANLFFGSGHTHSNINMDWHTLVAGNQTTQFTHYNEGSTTNTYEYDENGNYLGYETDYSIGYCVDIYDDMVVFQGRLFEDEEDGGSKYISHANYQIMMPHADKDLPSLILDGEMKDGAVLTPKFDKEYDGKIASYAWYVDGNVVSTASTYTVYVNEETCGKQVACRVIFEDGSYVSALSENIPGYKVTYDTNGGTGVIVEPQYVLQNAVFTPVVPARNPDLANHYFVGWSMNKDATEPDASFMAESDMTLYAVYKEGYTITYDANGGTGNVPVSTVVPKNAVFTPSIGGTPVISGKYFIGWSDKKDATEPMTSVYAKSSMTLYAVYGNQPKWYFDANLSGFSPNSAVTNHRIEDGVLYYSMVGASTKDLIFSNTKVNFMAEDYPVVRVKLCGLDAGGKASDSLFDGIFFQSPTSGYSEKKTKLPLSNIYKVAEADGMYILEIKIADVGTAPEYKGKISAIRFDAINSAAAEGYADYLVFTDKLGIFKADVTVDESGNVTLSEDTVNCSAKASVTKTLLGETITVTLTPDAGYEFTTREDVLALTTINNKKPDGAVVLSDGSAKIWLSEESAVTFGESGDDANTARVKIDKSLNEKVFVVAIYSGGVLCGIHTVTDASVTEGYVDVVAASSLNVDTVKIFAFDSLNSISPVTAPFVAYFK